MSLNYKNTTGSTLIEVLVAILIMAIVLTGLATALSYSLKNSAQADYRQVATRQAQDVIEILRKERSNLGWSDFESKFSTGSFYCVDTGESTISQFAVLPGTSSNPCANNLSVDQSPLTMTRYFERKSTADNVVQVEVFVKWQDGTATRTVNLIQDFRDIN